MAKKILILILVVFGVLYYTYQKNKFSVGDTGPAGGVVFYVTGFGFHGLESAREDQVNAPWGCYETVIDGADKTAVGTGAKNTASIIKGCIDSEMNAAEVASEYQINNFNSWFLPSLDELKLLHQKRHIVGGFDNDYYWSSSQHGTYPRNSWAIYFGKANHSSLGAGKGITLGVRAIRAF